jgi:hypothetical protein
MTEANERSESPESESLADGFRESLPLLLVAIVLLATGAVAWILNVAVGPARFPLGVILLTLGFIAGIGATLSWFFAGSPRRVRRETRAPPAEPAPVVEGARATGRPVPDVRVAPTAPAVRGSRPPEPWEETLPAESMRPGMTWPAGSSPDPETRALIEELERITRDLAPARTAASPPPTATRKKLADVKEY